MYRWYETGHPGHHRDSGALRRVFPGLRSVRAWMGEEGAAMVLEAAAAAAAAATATTAAAA
jgi:hypothetical protein